MHQRMLCHCPWKISICQDASPSLMWWVQDAGFGPSCTTLLGFYFFSAFSGTLYATAAELLLRSAREQAVCLL